jgi:arylsulfatase A-like enzyme
MSYLRLKTFVILITVFMAINCSGPESDQPILTAEMPLHLEEHLEDAVIEGSEIPANVPAPVEWRFDEPQPDWKPVKPIQAQCEAVKPVRVDDALRMPLTNRNRADGPFLIGCIYIALPDWHFGDWAYVEIRARTRETMLLVGLGFNYTEEDSYEGRLPFYSEGDNAPLITDGTVQTYRLSLDWARMRRWEGPWTHLGIWFAGRLGEEAVTLDILSVRIIPKEHIYADAPIGIRTVERSDAHRRTLYTHASGRLEYKVRVPKAGRLDVGLGVLREDVPVTFRIVASHKDEEEIALFEETYTNLKEWGQRTIDLSSIAGKTVRIALEADAERPGAVALWAAPTLTGTRSTRKPNVIFYIIDAAGADFMSLYGYSRPNTPNLEKLAAEGAVFDNAYSNSSWTKPSTPSFLTSLHHSVLGGYKSDSDPLPDQAVTMAQHLHRAGYQTAVFTTNAFPGTMTGLDRGVDVLRQVGIMPNSISSQELHKDFWKWREEYSNEPYWVHFQTTDVHPPFECDDSFAGRFVSPDLREKYQKLGEEIYQGMRWEHWGGEISLSSVTEYYDLWFERENIDRSAFYETIRGLYDEAMIHQDYQIGKLIERLKAQGEWERTLLIIASDHGHPAGSYARFGRGLIDPAPPEWEGAILGSFKTRIPMMLIWPGHIRGGQRFSQPVSMIDMLPTILDFAALPMPDVMQGQSLAPLLSGKKGWMQRPVIFDEFYVDLKTGQFIGNIEVIDGRWGASLEIAPVPEGEDYIPHRRYQAPASGRMRLSPHGFPNVPCLLLYDLQNDPYALHNVNEERPDLVKKYTQFLEAQWDAHQTLAKHFTRSKDSPLTPEQLETLRSLGYIR